MPRDDTVAPRPPTRDELEGMREARRDRDARARSLRSLGRPLRRRRCEDEEAARGLRRARGARGARAHRAARAPARPGRPHHQRDGRGVLPREAARGLGLEGIHGRLQGALQEAARQGDRRERRRRASGAGGLRARREAVFEKQKELGVEHPAQALPPLLPRGDRPGVGRPPHEHGAPARRHRPPRLRPARPEAGVQEGGLRPLPRT